MNGYNFRLANCANLVCSFLALLFILSIPASAATVGTDIDVELTRDEDSDSDTFGEAYEADIDGPGLLNGGATCWHRHRADGTCGWLCYLGNDIFFSLSFSPPDGNGNMDVDYTGPGGHQEGTAKQKRGGGVRGNAAGYSFNLTVR